ncbi:MAG: 5-oxopent-3-ene-1,2,5-tricarboxylate decarboxylase [Candidatus Poriferisodalaceae bacterium]|jgi:5-oxopent-3-ene-1,2,5-tricarboxylate decarboxylase / 2-hydroxyhepta-2,4-diene-1,7-dioate isomerase
MDQAHRTVELTDELKDQLTSVSTATLASQLQKRGMWNCFLSGLKPLHDEQSMIGYAHTLRYVPSRPDLAEIIGFNAQRVAVNSITKDEILIIEARGEADAGTIGDIFATRAQYLGAAGVITDGALRDTPAIKGLNMPVYHQSSHAATLGRLHSPLDHQIPIACAGVTVMPGDIIVGDNEGAIVIPAAWAVDVAADAVAMELQEEFAIERISNGADHDGYYPLSKENRPEFEAWLAAREG